MRRYAALAATGFELFEGRPIPDDEREAWEGQEAQLMARYAVPAPEPGLIEGWADCPTPLTAGPWCPWRDGATLARESAARRRGA
jgi:hypothetical protein